MFNRISPEQAGISSRKVARFLRALDRRGLVMHSVLLMKGSDIFAEYYWDPFDRDTGHRMYSQTKSYVAIAIGLLEEDGKLNLDDPIANYFPEKIDRELPEYLANQTIRQMLTMQTCGQTPRWFTHSDPDRTHLYFATNDSKMLPGAIWRYDSPASQVLSNIVEKLSGMSLFNFLETNIFDKLGTFKTASILKVRTEDSFGDSALLCTTRDMASFARFVMNYGTWNGQRIMNEEYLKTATSRIVDNLEFGFDDVFTDGYGYQIWRYRKNGFAFNGMGGQLTICIPEKDFIFTCTGDNQGYEASKSLLFAALDDLIIDNLGETLPENQNAYQEYVDLGKTLELYHLKNTFTPILKEKISGVTYVANKNPMGIKELSLVFKDDNCGEFRYINGQGEKVLPFGIGKNVFTKFPQLGYSNIHAGAKTDDGFMYDCAVSGCWAEESKFLLKVQVIDKYFGNLFCVFSFKDSKIAVRMEKFAEAFMDEYTGELTGEIKALF